MTDEAPTDFHAHIYFTDETRASALALRERLLNTTEFCVDVRPTRDRPIGPHPQPMFNVHVDDGNFAAFVHWLMRNHGPHPVLIHPVTGDDLRDHTHHAMWLGPALPLLLDALS